MTNIARAVEGRDEPAQDPDRRRRAAHLKLAGRHADIVGIKPEPGRAPSHRAHRRDLAPEKLDEKLRWLRRARKRRGRRFTDLEITR